MVARDNRPQKRASLLVFKGGDGGGVGKEQPPSKTSIHSSSSGVEMVELLARIDCPRKQTYVLVFEGGDGGGGGKCLCLFSKVGGGAGKEQPPLKTSVCARLNHFRGCR